MIAIVPTGGSNLASVRYALQRLNAEAEITADPDRIRAADRVILPGVGHAATMMAKLRVSGLDRVIPTLTKPVLGICLGMQILFEHSEEGEATCLGIIPGQVRAIPYHGLALPHMGWNALHSQVGEGFGACARDEYFYFVHSFMADDGPWTLATADYGIPVPAIVKWRNFHGTQFHPERSGAAGEALLSEFLCLN